MNYFGSISAGLWVISSVAWIWAACVKPPIEPHPNGNDQTFIFGDTLEESSMFGSRIPSFSSQIGYYKKTAFRNTIAAVVSAAAAIFAALALWFPNV
ncbi:hypothetical protein DNK03_08170 [Brucella anthropi]|uniref:hypothetical protein n=1 Tax=Brucella anthropi TaxID=529 RepID=UPI000DECDC1F|nr:hypothetical protein [Brucella anthropi]RCI79533.1 hypothetical protein DNK03_08170 [Brucella anthropi]